jgi:hypothetical protein
LADTPHRPIVCDSEYLHAFVLVISDGDVSPEHSAQGLSRIRFRHIVLVDQTLCSARQEEKKMKKKKTEDEKP